MNSQRSMIDYKRQQSCSHRYATVNHYILLSEYNQEWSMIILISEYNQEWRNEAWYIDLRIKSGIKHAILISNCSQECIIELHAITNATILSVWDRQNRNKMIENHKLLVFLSRMYILKSNRGIFSIFHFSCWLMEWLVFIQNIRW